MAWENTLLPASFRGIVFEVDGTDDVLERALVLKEYPYVNGVDPEDMGWTGRMIGMSAVFYGPDYEIQMQQFLDALEEAGAGELIHPVFGSIHAQFVRGRISHSHDRPDYAHALLEFIGAKLNAPLFDRVLPLQQVEAVNQAADETLAASQSAFGFDFTKVPNLPALLRDKLGADMLNVMDNMRSLADQVLGVRTWIASGLYYLNNPVAFLDDLSGGLVSRVKGIFSPMNLRLRYGSSGISGISTATAAAIAAGTTSAASTGYVRGSLADVWKAPVEHLKQPLLTLTPVASTPPSGPLITSAPLDGLPTQPFLSTHVQLHQTVAIAAAAAELYGLDLEESVLTPADIETVAADTRTAINNTIALVRATYPDIKQSRPMTEPLKKLALAVTDVAERLIRAKPPLVDRRVDTPGNLQLLAHLWYGDYRRADELLRLNPQVTNPNFIARGIVLKAYVA
jgi:prophage DNA circulation protein